MDDVCQMTFLLSRYFRANLSDGHTFVSVEQAAETVNSYIAIQKLRFVDRFHFTIEMDEAAKGLLVLKYLFQPLVENAVLHGLEKKNGPGHCKISFLLAKEEFRFCVEDDGRGILPEKLEELRGVLQSEEPRPGGNFALHNINLQLRLYYGATCPLQIESEWGRGSRVWFSIPRKALEKHV